MRAQRDLVVPRVHAGVGRALEHAHPDLCLCALAGPILHRVGERVGARRVLVRLVDHVVRADLGDASQLRGLVAQAEQLVVVAVHVDAGQCDRYAHFLTRGHLRLDVLRSGGGLVLGVLLMHGDGDCAGGRVAEIVLDGVGHREHARLFGSLITHGVAGNEHQSLERVLVVLQLLLQRHRGAVGMRDMVEHVHRHDAVGAHLRVDVRRLGRGVAGGQCRRLQHYRAGG